jgi:hypothetical protein
LTALWQQITLISSEVVLIVVMVCGFHQVMAAIDRLHYSINGRVNELLIETRRASIAETKEAIRKEREPESDGAREDAAVGT